MLGKIKDKFNKKSQEQADEKPQEKDPIKTQQQQMLAVETQANQARLHALRDKFLLGEITEEQYLKVRENILRGD
jgi:hypothetical protein